MFQKIKNRATSKATSIALKVALNKFLLKEYGQVLNIKLDSKNKSLEFTLKLKGEKEPLDIKIDEYELIKKGEKDFIRVKNIGTSREWINIVASKYLNGKEFEIPSDIVTILNILV